MLSNKLVHVGYSLWMAGLNCCNMYNKHHDKWGYFSLFYTSELSLVLCRVVTVSWLLQWLLEADFLSVCDSPLCFINTTIITVVQIRSSKATTPPMTGNKEPWGSWPVISRAGLSYCPFPGKESLSEVLRDCLIAMCWMFVPLFFSAPMSCKAALSWLALRLLFKSSCSCWAILLLMEWWYSTLRFPIPLLAFSLDRTV